MSADLAALTQVWTDWQRFIATAIEAEMDRRGLSKDGPIAALLKGAITVPAGGLEVAKDIKVKVANPAGPAIPVYADHPIDAVWLFVVVPSDSAVDAGGAVTVQIHAQIDGVDTVLCDPADLPTLPALGRKINFAGSRLAIRQVHRGDWLWPEIVSAPTTNQPQLLTIALAWTVRADLGGR